MPPKQYIRKEQKQIESPIIPQITASPTQSLIIQHPSIITTQHEKSKIGSLAGPIISSLSKYRNSGKITKNKYNKYLKDIHGVFAKFNADPRYSFLSEYDLIKHCMTEVDNYLFKNEPDVYKNQEYIQRDGNKSKIYKMRYMKM